MENKTYDEAFEMDIDYYESGRYLEEEGEDPDESYYDDGYDDRWDECGFDPYEGCYTWDC